LHFFVFCFLTIKNKIIFNFRRFALLQIIQSSHRENAHSLLAVSDSNGEIHWSEDEDWEFDDNKGMWLIPIIKDECIYVNGQYGDIEIQGSAIDCINDY
jgi:hypothetical protein